jgi:hypothetical protein
MTRDRESFRSTTYHAHPELQLAPNSDLGGWDDEEPRTPLEVFLRPLSPLDLPGKEHLERYLHYKYRLNRRGLTDSRRSWPHSPQKSSDCSATDPHFGHLRSSFAPHFVQNFLSALLSNPHPGQFIQALLPRGRQEVRGRLLLGSVLYFRKVG